MVIGRAWGAWGASTRRRSIPPGVNGKRAALRLPIHRSGFEQPRGETSHLHLSPLSRDVKSAGRGSVKVAPTFNCGARTRHRSGAPSLSFLHCELYDAIAVGDHTIAIGEVADVTLGYLADPLIYFRRRFCRITTPGAPDETGTRLPRRALGRGVA
jgi:hypothetical protein